MGKIFDYLMANGDYEAMQRIQLYKSIKRKLDSGESLTDEEREILRRGKDG